MQITYERDLKTGAQSLAAFVRREPVLYGQLLGILTRLSADIETFGRSRPHLWLVKDEHGALLGGALRTPPHPVQFTLMPREILHRLGAQIIRDDEECPGLIGVSPEVESLAQSMAPSLDSLECRLEMTLYELTKLQVPASGSLQMRKAGTEHTELVAAWLQRFTIDCNLPNASMGRQRLNEEIRSGRVDLGFDPSGEPVFMVMTTIINEAQAARLGGVYTPDGCRGKGHATEGIAKVVEGLLHRGIQHIGLFTDKRNPLSNRLYRNLGFEERRDVKMMMWRDMNQAET